MMMVQSFKELTGDERSRAGGKCATLARLYQTGCPVPDGFVILPPAFAGDEPKVEAWAAGQAQLARLRNEGDWWLGPEGVEHV
jgi:pyruvate,water dikinase